MRFKTDENLPVEIADLLSQHGHDAMTVPAQGLGGVADPAVAAACQFEKRVIVTLDLDFSDIRRYPPEDYAGIIVMRPVVQTISALEKMLARAIGLLGTEPLEGCLWIFQQAPVGLFHAERTDQPAQLVEETALFPAHDLALGEDLPS